MQIYSVDAVSLSRGALNVKHKSKIALSFSSFFLHYTHNHYKADKLFRTNNYGGDEMEEEIRRSERSKAKPKQNKKDDFFTPVTIVQIILCIILTAVTVITVKSGGTAASKLKTDFQKMMSWTFEGKDAESVMKSVKEYLSSPFEFLPAFSPVSPPDTTESNETQSDAQTQQESTASTTEAQTQEETTAQNETTEEQTTEEQSTTQEAKPENMKKTVDDKKSDMGGKDILFKAQEKTTFSPVSTTCPIVAPVDSKKYTSYFGNRVNPITNEKSFHTGLDIAAPLGTKIRAAYNGTVRKIGEDSHSGKYIFLTHSDGFETFYCHCSEILAEEGAVIRQGETIALVGSTGWSTGPHLHFEIRKDGTRLNPLQVLEKNDN